MSRSHAFLLIFFVSIESVEATQERARPQMDASRRLKAPGSRKERKFVTFSVAAPYLAPHTVFGKDELHTQFSGGQPTETETNASFRKWTS
eukprot:6191670-Pleurochrysis_carterae.AAC.1